MRCLIAAFLAVAGCGGAPCPPTTVAEPAATAGHDRSLAPPAREPAPPPDPPDGSVRVRPLGVQPGAQGYVLVLADDDGGRGLPVVIGASEAAIIDLRLRGERFERPLTHDLLDRVAEALGGEVVFVHIDKLRGGIFVGSVYLWDGHEMHRIDSRTSDAVAVALGHDAPIFVAPIVLDEAGEPLPPGLGP